MQFACAMVPLGEMHLWGFPLRAGAVGSFGLLHQGFTLITISFA